jgi:(R)-2-hydroxyglutarate---pyruvate transhydrogenase
VELTWLQCTNERPFCQKCISTGRDCEGYERERVFITGTLETRGRVASHPKKGSSSKKQRPTPEPSTTVPVLVSSQPLTSAWDDHTIVSSQHVEYSVLITALHTKLENILRAEGSDDGSSEFGISFPSYAPVDFQVAPVEEDLHVNAHCLARLPGAEEGDDVESYCVFLFDVSKSVEEQPNRWLIPDSTTYRLCRGSRGPIKPVR